MRLFAVETGAVVNCQLFADIDIAKCVEIETDKFTRRIAAVVEITQDVFSVTPLPAAIFLFGPEHMHPVVVSFFPRVCSQVTVYPDPGF